MTATNRGDPESESWKGACDGMPGGTRRTGSAGGTNTPERQRKLWGWMSIPLINPGNEKRESRGGVHEMSATIRQQTTDDETDSGWTKDKEAGDGWRREEKEEAGIAWGEGRYL
jgi:hypothetical protein